MTPRSPDIIDARRTSATGTSAAAAMAPTQNALRRALAQLATEDTDEELLLDLGRPGEEIARAARGVPPPSRCRR